jgi:hypothetical protein
MYWVVERVYLLEVLLLVVADSVGRPSPPLGDATGDATTTAGGWVVGVVFPRLIEKLQPERTKAAVIKTMKATFHE